MGSRTDKVVITGIAGNYPNSNGVYELRDSLFAKFDLISDDDRGWSTTHPEVPCRSGKIDGIETFDPGFFGMSKEAAAFTEPTLRIGLEKMHEAMVDAGHHPHHFEGIKAGMYVVTCTSDSEFSTFQLKPKGAEAITRVFIRIFIRNDVVGTEGGFSSLLSFAETLGPVDAIFNLAVVLQDALFENQTVESFRTSLIPKAHATRHLDLVSRRLCTQLRYFVVVSSTSCRRGKVLQTNYGMANSVTVRICEMRIADGYSALAIQWGAIGDVGLVADMQENRKELLLGGTLRQNISNCVRNLKTVSLQVTLAEIGMDSMIGVEMKQTLEREHEVLLTMRDIRNMCLAELKTLADCKKGDNIPQV